MPDRGPSRIAGALILTLGLVVAGCGAWSDRTGESGARASRPPLGIEVLVARSDLPRSTILQEAHLRWQPWPGGSYPPEGHLLKGQIRLANLYGSALRRDVAAGEPVLYDQIVRPRDPEFLAIAPRPGYRAYRLPVTGKVTSVEPVRAGDQVGVLLRRVKDKDGMTVVSVQVFLRNVRLLALVRDRSRASMTAILEVAPKQAENLDTMMTAHHRGEFSLYSGGLGAGDAELDCPEPTSPPH